MKSKSFKCPKCSATYIEEIFNNATVISCITFHDGEIDGGLPAVVSCDSHKFECGECDFTIPVDDHFQLRRWLEEHC